MSTKKASDLIMLQGMVLAVFCCCFFNITLSISCLVIFVNFCCSLYKSDVFPWSHMFGYIAKILAHIIVFLPQNENSFEIWHSILFLSTQSRIYAHVFRKFAVFKTGMDSFCKTTPLTLQPYKFSLNKKEKKKGRKENPILTV